MGYFQNAGKKGGETKADGDQVDEKRAIKKQAIRQE
jgi:hypothetical protein